MKLRLSHLILPIAGACTASAFGTMAFWDSSKAPILMTLSVIAAGVLVRLARGLPITNAENFELDEARRIAAAIKKSIRSLRILMIAIFLCMGAVIFGKTTTELITEKFPNTTEYVHIIMSGFLGFILTYIFVRILAVINADVGLVDLQTKMFVDSVARKQGERFNTSIVNATDLPIKNPQGYGRIIQ